jgi:hypothetical protein
VTLLVNLLWFGQAIAGTEAPTIEAPAVADAQSGVAVALRREQHDPMRAIGLTLAATVSALVALGIGTACEAHAPETGVRGLVLYGPTCPVSRPGSTCERPYRAWITIRSLPSEMVITLVHSAADGRFTVALAVGRYRLAPRNGKPYPRAAAQTVTVRSGRLSPVTIRFDSGIR